MATIEVHQLIKDYGVMRAVNGISFSADAGEIVVIVGASGCGKTTTLRCIAGLERPTGGQIFIEGQLVAAADVMVPPENRGIGMVFQSYALWPHKTVFENIAYGLRIKKLSRDEIARRVAEVVRIVGLTGLEARFPATLSGGQQQRVALARSAVVEPKLLLLDEPLSNLDAKLREQMRIDLRQLVKNLGMTAVHITHDQTEAMAIADRIIYMRNGRIEQQGTPRELYRSPVTRAVADFVGSATFIDGKLVGSEPNGDVRVELANGLVVTAKRPVTQLAGDRVTLGIRPETVDLLLDNPGGPNVFAASVVQSTFLGAHSEYLVDLGGVRLTVHDARDFEAGDKAFVRVDPRSVVCLPPVA